MKPIIKVENLSKQYHFGARRAPYLTLRESLAGRMRASLKGFRPNGNSAENTIWALNDVSFEVKPGEVVGIIGHNGAGKSTLLKILSRISEPTLGQADLYGRVGSLLEVGTGFHPELTGRDNVYLNGAILGMTRSEIDCKFDEIVAFAEVDQFIDTPVKRYSSGMYLRLAFAVAAHLELEILAVDEVLAVGDTAFQKKCMGKMGDVVKEGRTILFVSHNLGAIEGLCRRALLLEQGRLVKEGTTHAVVEAYLSSMQTRGSGDLYERVDRQGNGRLKFSGFAFISARGQAIDVIQSGQDVEFSVSYMSEAENLNNVSLSIAVYTLTGQCMLFLNNDMAAASFRAAPRTGQFVCRVERFPLTAGQYYINLYCEVNGILADWVQQAVHFTVEAGDFYGTGRLPPQGHGGLLVAQSWSVGDADSIAQGGLR